MAVDKQGLTFGQLSVVLESSSGAPMVLAEAVRGGGIIRVQNDSDRTTSIDSRVLDNNMIILNPSE